MIQPGASTELEKRNRTIALTASLVVHAVLMIVFSFFMVMTPKQPQIIELDWGMSGGAPNNSISQTEANPNNDPESAAAASAKTESKLDLPTMKSPSAESVPSTKKVSKATTSGTGKAKTGSTSSNTTSRRRRSDSGVAGGSGKSTGYSIDWAGSGNRRLISGRLPRYPDGTNKELPVTLQFTVLPDGSVSGVIPVMKSDMLLEREAISALRTWRFDPLPPQFAQGVQQAKITFKFVIE
jgi:periplasmic protein TonB